MDRFICPSWWLPVGNVRSKVSHIKSHLIEFSFELHEVLRYFVNPPSFPFLPQANHGKAPSGGSILLVVDGITRDEVMHARVRLHLFCVSTTLEGWTSSVCYIHGFQLALTGSRIISFAMLRLCEDNHTVDYSHTVIENLTFCKAKAGSVRAWFAPQVNNKMPKHLANNS